MRNIDEIVLLSRDLELLDNGTSRMSLDRIDSTFDIIQIVVPPSQSSKNG